MSEPRSSRAARAARRLGRRLHAPSALLPRRARVADWSVRVPRGVRHPHDGGSTSFLVRTVGPMIAPGQRVLVVEAGAGLVPIMAASRGASVVAATADARSAQATRDNALRAGLPVSVRQAPTPAQIGDDSFDLVLVEGLATDPAWLSDVLEVAPAWLGDRGRLVLVSEIDRAPAALDSPPFGYRWVQLSRSLSLFSPWVAHSLGWDLAAARERRHTGRGRPAEQRRRDVHRRRWEGPGRAGEPRDPRSEKAQP